MQFGYCKKSQAFGEKLAAQGFPVQWVTKVARGFYVDFDLTVNTSGFLQADLGRYRSQSGGATTELKTGQKIWQHYFAPRI